MTIQNIIDGICEALNGAFGSDYELHTEAVEQGLKEPCFLIRCISPTKVIHLGRRYLRTNQFAIQFFPKSTLEPLQECQTVLETMFDCLESVKVSGRIVHGSDVTSTFTDGVLTFTVNYNAFVLKEEVLAMMEDLSIKFD